MLHSDSKKHDVNVSLTAHMQAQLPHILRQSNYVADGDMRTANVNFIVKKHEADAEPAPVNRGMRVHELYPTQSSARTDATEHVDDWHKHAIVASVAGLQSKLAQLDSEIRSGASADAAAPGVVRQLQDHATLLRENAKLLSATQSKHKESAALTHRICSQMHDSAQQHAATLGACKDDIAQLKSKQSTSVGLVHDICSELQKGLLEHGEDSQGLQRDVSLLQKKDAVAQALLTKMLAMVDRHESVLAAGKHDPAQQVALLDGLCAAFERTKTKMLGFESAQKQMQQVIDDFQAARLPLASALDAEGVQTKLDRYMRLSKEVDGHCRQALEQHGAKMDELQRTHQQALHEQRMKLQQLERAQQHAVDEQQSKMQTLERQIAASQSQHKKIADLEGKVQELALLHLNSSQKDSITRASERDLKLLQHDMRQLHSLKKDVEAMHEATTSNFSSIKEDVRKMQGDSRARSDHSLQLHKDVQQVKSAVDRCAQAQQTAAVDKSIAEMHAKMLDMKRDVALLNIRVDKTATSMHDIHCKLAA